MILIAGATGTNGRMLTNLLASAGYQVRALVRNLDSAQSLIQPNVQLYKGDLASPSSLDGAFDGVDRAFVLTTIVPNTVELFQNFFDAARRTTGAHVVKFSALGAGYADSVVQQQHTDSDEALIASGGSSELLILVAKYCLTSRWLHQSDELRSSSSRLWDTAKPVMNTLAVDRCSRHQMLQVCLS